MTISSEFLQYVLHGRVPAYSEDELYVIYRKRADLPACQDTKNMFADMMKRMSANGTCAKLFDGMWVFPNSEPFAEIADISCFHSLLVQNALASLGHRSHKGGFDVLYEMTLTTVPPKRKIVFADVPFRIDIDALLTTKEGKEREVSCVVVPWKKAGIGNGIIVEKVGKLEYRTSTAKRAIADAKTLCASAIGKALGISGQSVLLDQIDPDEVEEAVRCGR